MKVASQDRQDTYVAATVAPEDVACGDFVAVLTTACEVPSYMWDSALLPPHELVRLCFVPADAGDPLRVFGVCLPFVYVKTSAGEPRTIDLRRHQLARISPACAKRVWQERKRAKKV